MGKSPRKSADMHEAPPQPMKPASRNAEKAMKRCNSRNEIKKSRLSWMLPLGITVAIIAFLMAIQFRGQGNELNGTWWDNEWMDEEDFSNDMTIQQRLRETKMEENKEEMPKRGKRTETEKNRIGRRTRIVRRSQARWRRIVMNERMLTKKRGNIVEMYM